MVRLIRSKGVGVFFVTQNPLDVPDKVLAQLGNRVQHALRAFTPRDQKAVRAAAETFRPNPKLDTAQVITELGKGEALVSFLEGNGTPSMVERAMICAAVRAHRAGDAAGAQGGDRARARSGANTTRPSIRVGLRDPAAPCSSSPRADAAPPAARPGPANRSPTRRSRAPAAAGAMWWAACSATCWAGAAAARADA